MLEAVVGDSVPGSPSFGSGDTEDNLAGVGEGELPPYREQISLDRETGRHSRGRRCVHYHTHYHTHSHSCGREETARAIRTSSKATGSAASWGYWSIRHRRGRQGRSRETPGLYTFRASTRNRTVAAELDRAIRGVIKSNTAQQHSETKGLSQCFERLQGDKRHQGKKDLEGHSAREIASRKGQERSRAKHSFKLYPWVHPYLRASKVRRTRKISNRQPGQHSSKQH